MKNITYSFLDINELDSLIGDEVIDSKNTLIQLFTSHSNIDAIKKYQAYFIEKFPDSVLIGTTTDGNIEATDVYVDTKDVVSFSIFERSTLKSAFIEHRDNLSSSYESGISLAKALSCDNTKVIISFADGINTNGEEFVKGVTFVSPNITLSGGLAADNGALVKTYVFNKEHSLSNGAVGVSINSQHLNVSTSYTFDWMPIGKEMKVTKAIKNRVYEIDGLSTVDIYAKYMGQDLANNLPQIGIEFPLIFERNGLSIGRAVVNKHKDGSLTFAGNIQEGDSVRFGVGSIETILKNSDYNTRKLLDQMKYQTEAVFIYSCMARRRFMNEYMHDELKIISQIGDISGFFTYGEFFHSNESNQLLNETMTVLALSENDNPILNSMSSSLEKNSHFGIDAQHVVAHLANKVSNELAELNNSLEEKIKESSAYIYQQAYYDTLTGLPNRLSLIKKVSHSIGKMVILINIDDFTTINDFYGHEVGDTVLKRLSEILLNLTKDKTAEVFKLPSDEFAIIVDMSQINGGMQESIKHCIVSIEKEDFLVRDGHFAHVSVTISAALINANETGLVNADMALKLAKKVGLDFMIFNEDLKLAQKYEENIKMANIIKNAISHDNIIPYFQPIVNIKTEKIEKYEALVRLKIDETQVLSPFAFLEISQKIKLYPQITKIMVDKTFAYFSKNGLEFSINLSLVDIFNDKTREYLFAKIKEYDIASQLTIEILETMENDNQALVETFIDRVYESGACIAIDDFGSGFANFQHMTALRSDIMKIDGSLIKNIATDKNTRLVVETIVVFAKKLNKKIVAEFVHSQEVYDIVRELGIDYAQGYHLGKPLPSTL